MFFGHWTSILIFLWSTRIFCLHVVHAEQPGDIYSFEVKDIKGNVASLSEHRGKVLLIVNVASECGFTDNHYHELVKLQDTFGQDNFVILAFPCNQFGQQEPKKNSAIERFANENYNINFPLFAKVKTVGSDAHPLYKWLKNESGGEEPMWNFCKYLIDGRGKVVKFESPHTSPLQMYADINGFIKHKDLYEGGTDQNQRQHTDEL